MPDDGSPRRLMRRLVVAVARALALLILVAGFSGALAIALPNVQPLLRYGAALLLGVTIFETLRPRRREAAAAAVAPPSPAESPVTGPSAEELTAAQRVIEELKSDAERSRQEAQKRTDSLNHDVQELLATNASLRQQIDKTEADLKQTRAKAAADTKQIREQLDTELTQTRTKAAAETKKLREEFEAESAQLQRGASKALEEIEKTGWRRKLRPQVDRSQRMLRRLPTRCRPSDKLVISGS
jgi:hypothetical protein